MPESIEGLEQRIEALRAEIRRLTVSGKREQASALRRQLRQAEREWDNALADLAEGEPGQTGSARASRNGPGDREASRAVLLPLRDQVHQTLTLLTVPAAPRLISAVHEAIFAGAIATTRLTSLRRDEERSFRSAPFARPYYVCAALTADLLAPVRGLLAISTWPMDRRVIGPLSPRVDYLTAAVRIAESVQRMPGPGPAAMRLLWRFAANIPGGADRPGQVEPSTVAEAARAELAVHADADAASRRDAAARARQQLDDPQQLFGTRLGLAPRAGTGT